MIADSPFPTYTMVQQTQSKNVIHVITLDEVQTVPEDWREDFKKNETVTIHKGKDKTHYVCATKASQHKITENSYLRVSEKAVQLPNYYGFTSDLLTSAYKFSRKSQKGTILTVECCKNMKNIQQIISLAEGKNQAKEWANGRGDVDGTPQYFEQRAQQLSKKFGLKLTVIKGDDLVKDGFRLMHAVGRASRNTPTFINLSYNGNPQSDKWVAYVGKGVCFDAGGLDIKPAAGMKQMYLDKHGACSILSAFQYIVQEKLKINLTCSLGFVENFISDNSYRPSDIIRSRKGLTVQIGNTDAEGRLVLADCMNWTQQHYKTQVLIQLSTLTGAIIIALGSRFAGLFTNNCGLCQDFKKAGETVNEECWQMPVNQYHRDLVRHQSADLTNHSCKPQAGSSQAAAFLKHFVEEGTKWIHLDIAGVCMVSCEGSGFGSRVLIQYARNYAKV